MERRHRRVMMGLSRRWSRGRADKSRPGGREARGQRGFRPSRRAVALLGSRIAYQEPTKRPRNPGDEPVCFIRSWWSGPDTFLGHNGRLNLQ